MAFNAQTKHYDQEAVRSEPLCLLFGLLSRRVTLCEGDDPPSHVG